MAAPKFWPSGLIKLSSREGQQLIQGCSRINQKLVELHQNQTHRKLCGPASLANLCNAMNVAYRIKFMLLSPNDKEGETLLMQEMEKGSVKIDENDVLKSLGERFIMESDVKNKGLTLEQLSTFAMHLKLGCTTQYVIDKETLVDNFELLEEKRKNWDSTVEVIDTLSQFRDTMVRQICPLPKSSNNSNHIQGVIANYSLPGLGFDDAFYGHISPVAAYHEQRDMFLVMDVWPEIPPFWVSSQLLWESMSRYIDGVSGLCRGFLHVYELL